MRRAFGFHRLGVFLVGLSFWVGSLSAQAPFFDVHTHYKWDQAEITTPQQALAFMDTAGVRRAVVIGTPPELALQLKAAAPDRFIVFYGPYKVGGEKLSWQFRKSLVNEARAGFATGQYQGIGELHLIGGMAAHWHRSPVLKGLMAIAREYRVPVMVHTEYAKIDPTVALCQAYSDVRILFAHAGAVLKPKRVAQVLEACPNAWMDLAARDPWRFLAQPITDKDGRLLPEWLAVIKRYPRRFMVGSDTVWPVDRHARWDEPDSGWQELPRFIAFHRHWIAQLPEPLAERLRWGNAAAFFAQP